MFNWLKKKMNGNPDEEQIQACSDELQAQGENPPIMPILKPDDWRAREFVACESFSGIEEPAIPVVAYCHDTSENFVFLTISDLKTQSLDDMREEAMVNIQSVDVQWTSISEHMLTGSGHDFSAEKILCREFLRQAQDILKADKIIVAVPRRTVIYAVNANAPQEQIERFRYLCHHTYLDDSFGNAPITQSRFHFVDGGLVALEMVEAA